jgi:hypothetical protein
MKKIYTNQRYKYITEIYNKNGVWGEHARGRNPMIFMVAASSANNFSVEIE